MRRDRITFAMMLGVPLMQLVLFGFAINNDPKQLPAALVATSNDHYTRAMVSALETTGYYRFEHVAASAAGGRSADPARRGRLRRDHPARLRPRLDAGDPRRS
jgi:ABC-2 type transport system permease protein